MLEWVDPGHGVAIVRRGAERELVTVEGGPSAWVVTVRGRRIAVTARTPRERLLAAAGALGRTSPRPG